MATRFLYKDYGADSSTAIANDATGTSKVRNLPNAAGIIFDSVDNTIKMNQNDAIVSILDSASAQTITGVKQIGTFSSTTAGSGVALSASKTAAFPVYVDDGGASIASSVLMRAILGRTLLTYTAGNREQEAAGIMGQLKSVAGTNRHNMAGLLGSYEAQTSLTVDGQSAATDTWAQAAVIGRVGVGSAITTINANGVLAGFAAMSNTTSFVANNGAFPAFYAGAWNGTTRWQYGLLLESDKVVNAIKFSTTALGIDATVTALGATATANNFIATVTAPHNESGMSAYFETDIKGTTAGHCYGLGSWINTSTGNSPVLSASNIIVPYEGGVYTGEAQASARIVFAGQHQAILNGAPASLHAWRLNTTQTITALIAAANAGSIGYTAGVGAGTAVGWVSFCEVVGGPTPGYIKIYSATA